MDFKVDEDSDAPEEFTSHQGIQQDEEIRKLQLQSKARVRREGKERRRKRLERLTPRPTSQASPSDGGDEEMVEDEEQDTTTKQSLINKGMLPSDIVNVLAAREKQVFLSDSDEEKNERKEKRKKRTRRSGVETVILNKLPPTPCVENALEFLKQRKMQVPRSNAVLNNSNRALRLLSSSGLL